VEIELVRQARAGNREAFEGLIRAHARLVWSYVYGLLRDSSLVEDMVQETFFRAWKGIRMLQDESAFRSWLISIAKRTCWETEERRARKVPPPAQDYLPAEPRLNVHDALHALPERYRLPLTLRYLEGLGHQDIGERLGLTNGTLRGLLQRGIKKLREHLKGMDA
jgi:RNA polymerase sigma-70 factor (ECF subfamily)